jgi:Carboxylesterase family
MSGTATAPRALVDNARERGLKFASSVGCSVLNGTEHIKQCLKQIPSQRLLGAMGQFFVRKSKIIIKNADHYV